jgi:hypothetical protein
MSENAEKEVLCAAASLSQQAESSEPAVVSSVGALEGFRIDTVEVHYGRSIKTGDYESARADLTLKGVLCGGDAVDAVLRTLWEYVHTQVEAQLRKALELAKAKLAGENAAAAAACGESEEVPSEGVSTAPATAPAAPTIENLDCVHFKVVCNGETLFFVREGTIFNMEEQRIGQLTAERSRFGSYWQCHSMPFEGIITASRNGKLVYKEREGREGWKFRGVVVPYRHHAATTSSSISSAADDEGGEVQW